MPSDKPAPSPDPYIAALRAGEERRRDMLRELAELETKVARAMAKRAMAATDAEVRRAAMRDFGQPSAGDAPGGGGPGGERPTYH